MIRFILSFEESIMQRSFMLCLSVLLVSTLLITPDTLAQSDNIQARGKPNVVLIICDDLNDFVEGMDGHPQAHTPAIRKLASSGVMFKRAYCNNPVCAPSRASFFTGLYNHTARNLFWDDWRNNPIQSNSKTIPEMFRDNGYRVVGSGKNLHHHSKAIWDEYPHEADYGPAVWDGQRYRSHPAVPKPFADIGAIDGSYGSLANVPYADDDDSMTGWVYGAWGKPQKALRYQSETNRDRTPDEMVGDWAVKRIKQFHQSSTDQPFFMSIGFLRPHTPLHAPQKYFDLFPLDKLKLPAMKAGDVEDCGHLDVFGPGGKGRRYYRLLKESYSTLAEGLRAYVQAYLACVAAADDQIGRVVDAIDQSRFRDNTIIVVTSDHGFHLGEKEWIFKNSLWEESARVPLIIRAPGVAKAGSLAEHPVSLIDLYPTLVDLCGLAGSTMKNTQGRPLDGHSMRPFLVNPKSDQWDGPEGALTMVYSGKDHDLNLARQHWSLRTKRWRYVLYNNGNDELYDHDNDPYEWTNLVDDSAYAATRDRLRNMLLERIGVDEHPYIPEAAKPLEGSLGRSKWRIVSVTNEETRASDHAAANAIDGDIETMWHTAWSGTSKQDHPHEIVIDLGEEQSFTGFAYLPRQVGNMNGTIDHYAFDISTNGQQWNTVAEGHFSELVEDGERQLIAFKQAQKARYIRLRALSEINNGPHTSVAELDLLAITSKEN